MFRHAFLYAITALACIMPAMAGGKPIVYYTSEITPKSLTDVYRALNPPLEGTVAIKISTGEPPKSNYLSPDLISPLVKSLNGTIVECNTAYGDARSNTKNHYKVVKEHGFDAVAPVKILDEDGSMTLTVRGGEILKENIVGKGFASFDSYLVLSHFKGHAMAGFGGAIKNTSIGIASSKGKAWIHSGGRSSANIWGGKQNEFLMAMAEAAKSVSDSLDGGKRIAYINIMNRLSVDCDCNGNPAEPGMEDLGIVASTDPVAADQAAIDMVYKNCKKTHPDKETLIERIESRNGLLTLSHAEKIGLGSRKYTLVDISK